MIDSYPLSEQGLRLIHRRDLKLLISDLKESQNKLAASISAQDRASDIISYIQAELRRKEAINKREKPRKKSSDNSAKCSSIKPTEETTEQP
jgi:hypothetical protein